MSAPFTLHFAEWRCGHHGMRPADIELHNIEQALPICRAIAAAISQPGQARAMLMSETHAIEIYITDDYARAEFGSNDGDSLPDPYRWPYRPEVIYGTESECAEIMSADLSEARENEFPPIDAWDGKGYVDSGDVVITTLAEADLLELVRPVDWYEEGERKKRFGTPPRLRSASDVLTLLREVQADFDAMDAEQDAQASKDEAQRGVL